MNLAGLPPLGLKTRPDGEDADYLAKVRELPCCVCEASGERQTTPTTAHHPICGRFSGRKVPDRMAIPLCQSHHQGQGPGDCSIHHHRAEWMRLYGADHEYIAATQDHILGDSE